MLLQAARLVIAENKYDFKCGYTFEWASQVLLVVKNPPASAGQVREERSIPGWGDPLEEGMATHSSVLSWRTRRTEEPGGLLSIGSRRVRRY